MTIDQPAAALVVDGSFAVPYNERRSEPSAESMMKSG
jgi:hypothetical protein